MLRFICLLFLAAVGTVRAADIAPDNRQPVALNAEEKAFVLSHMRDHLSVVQSILTAIGAGDTARAHELAAGEGMVRLKNPDALRQRLSEKTPPAWRSYLVAMRTNFDVVADSCAKNEPPLEIVRKVSTLMSTCVACHTAHRIVEEK